MTGEEIVRNILANNLTVSGIVSSRIYSEMAPQKSAFPYLIYSLISEDENPFSSHPVDGDIALRFSSVEVDSVGETKASATALADAVRDVLRKYRGTVSNYSVRGIFPENRSTEIETPQSGQERGAFHVVSDFRVCWLDPVPE